MASTRNQRASSSSSSSSSASASITRLNHDVFLSFRGKDTRYTFTDHLYTALVQKGIRTFRDDRLTRGEFIGEELLKTIEESRISIVIFSENYAYSRWCLKELVKIMECMKERGQTVISVFYHVDPSDVRNQRGSFGKALSNYGKETKENIGRWRAALNRGGSLSGWHVEDGCYESQHIREIIDKVSSTLNNEVLYVDKNLVGIGSRLKEITSLLCTESNDVRMVGIYGCGGIGKTTITKVVYDKIACQFESTCFLANVREISKDGHGLLELQKQLLDDTLVGNHNISHIDQGIKMIQNTLHSKKVLIILDDVDHSSQLESLVQSHDWFGRGSRIIITTRDKHLLAVNGVDKYLYEVKELNSREAMKLFSMNAFKQKIPKEGYTNLSKSVVDYTKGLPLVLKVLGSFLFNKTIPQWESALNKLKKEPNMQIQNVLRISFDGLDDIEKDIFLDIACFFKGKDEDFVTKILDECGFYAKVGLRVLSDKCLITISCKKVSMHDVLQQMGWDIVRQEYPKEPGKWSRLWNLEDIYRVLTRNMGTETIEGIFLDMSTLEHIKFTTEAFKMLSRLRLLKVHQDVKLDSMMTYLGNVDLSQAHLFEDFEFPSNELRYLHWDGFFLESLPSSFQGENLIELNLRCSNIKQLWKGHKVFEKLKVINLSHSKHLIDITNISSVPNLEILNLEGCKNLKSLPSDICKWKHLQTLTCTGCSNLESFPEITETMENLRELDLGGTAIKELPSSIEHLKGLHFLYLASCQDLASLPETICNLRFLRCLYVASCPNLKTFPENLGSLQCLEALNAECTSHQFPSLSGLFCLRLLNLSWSTAMQGAILSDICCLYSMECLDLSNCNIPEGQIPVEICLLSSLEVLNLRRNHFSSLPASIDRLSKLRILRLSHCKMLLHIPELPSSIRVMDAHDCSSLETLSSTLWSSLFKCFRSAIQKLEGGSSLFGRQYNAFFYQGEGISILIPESGGIPEWIRHQRNGSKVEIELPWNWYANDNFLGFALYAVYDPLDDESENEYDDEFENKYPNEPEDALNDPGFLYPKAYFEYKLNFHDDEFGIVDHFLFESVCECYPNGGVSDQAWVTYYPKVALVDKHGSNQCRYFKASFRGSYSDRPVKVKKCGVGLIYAQDDEHNQPITLDHRNMADHRSALPEVVNGNIQRSCVDDIEITQQNHLSEIQYTDGNLLGVEDDAQKYYMCKWLDLLRNFVQWICCGRY